MRHIAIGLALALGLTACAAVDTSGWPNPSDVQTGVDVLDATYQATCAANKGAWWCGAAQMKQEKVCKAAADSAVATYKAAYDSGNVTQAVLDNEGQIASTLAGCIAKIKGKG